MFTDLRQSKALVGNRELLCRWKKVFSLLPVFKDFFAERLFGLSLKPSEGTFAVPTQYGFSMVVAPLEGGIVEASIYRSGTYESGVLSFIEEYLSPGDAVVDVGANVGVISAFCAKKVGEKGVVYSFEPVSKTAELLRQTVVLNHFSNVKIFEMALSNISGKAPIFSSSAVNRGGSSLSAGGHGRVSQEVPLQRLDMILSPEEWRCVKLMKVDVEGWELEALEGVSEFVSATGHAPALIVEFSKDGEKSKALYKFLVAWPKSKVYKLPFTKRCAGNLVEVKSWEDLPKSDNLFVVPCT